MAEYLPLYIAEVVERKDTDTGEIRKTAVCKTVQPETISLNLSRVDSARIQRIMDNQGGILMIPVRRGEFNGRPFTSIADGHIFRDPDVVANFELQDSSASVVKPVSTAKPANDSVSDITDNSAPSAVAGGKGLFSSSKA